MAYDEGVADLIRDDLVDLHGIVEKKMFGGLCFMWQGNMLCGTMKNGAMYRVGKHRHSEALDIEGVSVMDMTGREMKGFVIVDPEVLADDARRTRILGMAQEFVASLPAK